MRVLISFYVVCLAYTLYRDFQVALHAHAHVEVVVWKCYKTSPTSLSKSKEWNRTLFSFPGLQIHSYRPNKPVEYLFDPNPHLLILPWSEKALSLGLSSDWQQGEELCLYVNEIWTVCNAFICRSIGECLIWPVIAPVKSMIYLLDKAASV